MTQNEPRLLSHCSPPCAHLPAPPPTPCPGGPPPLLQIALDDPANRIVIGAPSGSVLFVPDPMHVVWRPTMYFQRSLR